MPVLVDLIKEINESAFSWRELDHLTSDDLNTKAAILDQRRLQKLNEVQELKIQYEAASNGLALIRQEISTLEPLVRSGLAPETRLIALKRDEEASIGTAQ